MDPGWLSNAYVVADKPGGMAVFVDSGAPLEPLLARVEEWGVTPTHVLRTHAHGDHVAHEAELSLPVVTGALSTGDLEIEATATPGHSDDMVCFVVNGDLVFSGDSLFKDAVGGGDFAAIKRVVMDVYMAMPHERRVLPGHTDETTIAREWESNPFVRVWRGADPEGTTPCRVGGRDARLVVWSPDYDGKGKGGGAGPRGPPPLPRRRPRRPACRLVSRLRRQGEGVGSVRRRRRCARRRLPRRADLTASEPF